MKQHRLAKLNTFFAVLGLSWGIMSNVPAQGATFSFTQKSLSGDPFISGTFSGEDANNDNRLFRDELTAFEAFIVESPVSFSLDNLFFFDYILGTKNLIFFEVERWVEVNREFTDSEFYLLVVNGFASFSVLVIEFYLDDQLIAIADGATNQPVRVRQLVPSVPEPSLSNALLLLLGLGLTKRLLFKSFS